LIVVWSKSMSVRPDAAAAATAEAANFVENTHNSHEASDREEKLRGERSHADQKEPLWPPSDCNRGGPQQTSITCGE
jgi:hypothetical protein